MGEKKLNKYTILLLDKKARTLKKKSIGSQRTKEELENVHQSNSNYPARGPTTTCFIHLCKNLTCDNQAVSYLNNKTGVVAHLCR